MIVNLDQLDLNRNEDDENDETDIEYFESESENEKMDEVDQKTEEGIRDKEEFWSMRTSIVIPQK